MSKAEELSLNQIRLCDDGNGGLLLDGVKINGASVNYATGDIRVPKSAFKGSVVSQNYQEMVLQQGGKPYVAVSGSQVSQSVDILAPREASLSFISAADTRPIEDSVSMGSLTFDLLANVAYPRAIMPNSWVFDIGGKRVIERDSTLYETWDALTGTGKVVGHISDTGILHFNNISVDLRPVVKVLQGVYTQGDYQVKQFYGRTALAPIKPQSFTVYADLSESETLQGQSQADESISGSLKGKMAYKTGFFSIESEKPIPPDTLRYNAVSQSTVPINSREVGINPTRLPSDGKVPIFRRGDYIVITNKLVQDIGSAHSAGQVIQLQRQNNDRLCVVDANGKHVLMDKYLDDLDAGTLTWQTPLDLSDYTMPLSVIQLWQEDNKVVDTDISGSLKLQNPISRDYPQENTYISSAVSGGDLICRATEPFTQVNWTGKWQNTPDGNPAKTSLNTKDYPIRVTSDGTVDGRWRIVFRDANQIEVYEENMGLLWRGDILADIAPINPATNKPYFTLPKQAFGIGGWEQGNVIRFNTEGTLMPVWILRVVQPHKLPRGQSQANSFSACLRGNTEELE
ncbi:hypothetical protein [Wielerella bovis]|uniref:hypothetical protein n=1 Tax=Wielerella bovis TaxID=2917790 RepID=UPI00201968B4|nr:hypothetical protein [Wielerella bovis]MCG7655947.1 hypothetical protein [Wielerella bovis]MCG7655970.1 hypothetical protein [Wielerella bovis]MCG7656864.1 hypothetical protein [Wielerella bovis]MCG7657118.1 hypothetical protein [Wielerella bovis]MCG7658136.1 hypothetical protein [Wielerella bovis]